jgi:5-methylcytosine-specific restriction endonuclease McrA
VRRVLLLNVTYEPLTTVGLRRAVCLVLGGKAEIVHDDAAGAVLHAATVALATPSVIRLRRYVRVPYRNRVPLTRAALMRRDNYRCVYCGRRAETIDHVLPRSRGGQHAWENCVASCTICNHQKADRLLEELGWTLAVPPAVPRGAHWRLVGAHHDGDPQWAAYLREPSAALDPGPRYRAWSPYRTFPPQMIAAFSFSPERIVVHLTPIPARCVLPARLRALLTRRLPSSLRSSVRAAARPLARGAPTQSRPARCPAGSPRPGTIQVEVRVDAAGNLYPGTRRVP